MKLVSLRTDNGLHGGVLLDAGVLDFAVLMSSPDIDRSSLSLPEVEGSEIRDALDLLALGEDWLRSTVKRVTDDAEFHHQCEQAGALIPSQSVRLGPPVANPGKILAVGLNYRLHAEETGAALPEKPLIFTKNTSALIGPEDEIKLPAISDKIDYEAELAFVIGQTAKNVKASKALEYIAGYTIMNDVTARDLQKNERQWARAKGLDTFAPCGPWLVTRDEIPDPHVLDIQLRLNSEIRQDSNTNDLIFKLQELIAFISEDLTLNPGDIVTTGTPPGVGYARKPPSFLHVGDCIEITIQGLGTLRNVVAGWTA